MGLHGDLLAFAGSLKLPLEDLPFLGCCLMNIKLPKISFFFRKWQIKKLQHYPGTAALWEYATGAWWHPDLVDWSEGGDWVELFFATWLTTTRCLGFWGQGGDRNPLDTTVVLDHEDIGEVKYSVQTSLPFQCLVSLEVLAVKNSSNTAHKGLEGVNILSESTENTVCFLYFLCWVGHKYTVSADGFVLLN